MSKIGILVLEDEIVTYMYISQKLKEFGYENIYIARNSTDALEIASKNKIDLMFSDINIEGDVDGIDTAYTIQKLYKTPVIFITAYNDKELLKRVSKIDTLGFLLKPFRPDELETLINLAIEKFQLESKECDMVYKDYIFNKNSCTLCKNDEKIELSKKEQLFINLLFSNTNNIISYEVLDQTIWFDKYVSDNARRTFLHRFKNKFEGFEINIEKNVGIAFNHISINY